MSTFDLIFGNGGGITLQTAGYCHYFNDDEKDAAECVNEILNGTSPADWDGNEPEHRIEYNYEIERNGGYRWVSGNEVLKAVSTLSVEERSEWLENISRQVEREFYRVLFELRDNV